MDSFAAPEGGGVGGSVGAEVVEYVRLVLGRRRRQRNGCRGFTTAMIVVCDFVVLGAVVVGEMCRSLRMIKDESR